MDRQTKVNVALWALYDFANSLVWTGFLFFFPLWLVVEERQPAWWFNSALIASSVLFILTAPFVSRTIDKTGRKIQGLRLWTTLSFIAFLLAAGIIVFTSEMDGIATLLFVFGSYAYLVCFLYFTPMLNDLSTNATRAGVSGIGQGANLLGQGLILIISLPLVTGAVTLFSDQSYALAFVLAAVLFFVFSLPMLLFYKENTSANQPLQTTTPVNLLTQYKHIIHYKPLLLALLAYLLYSDAVLTFASNFPLYLEIVHAVSDSTKIILTVSILLLAAAGSPLFGFIAQKIGELTTIKIIVSGWCIIFLLVTLALDFTLLIPVFLIAGILYGPLFGVSRAFIGKLAQRESTAATFSVYVIAERFASLIGPALWSLALIVVGENTVGYQAALTTMLVILLLSIVPLMYIRLTQH